MRPFIEVWKLRLRDDVRVWSKVSQLLRVRTEAHTAALSTRALLFQEGRRGHFVSQLEQSSVAFFDSHLN